MLSSYNEKGIVKRTNNQVKKFYTQFTKKELEILTQATKHIDVNSVRISGHVHREYNIEDIKEVIKHNIIKEYNTNTITKEDRIVLEGTKKIKMMFDGKMQYVKMTLVYSITNNNIVTLYYNTLNDKHATLNMHRYMNIKIDTNRIKKVMGF